MLKLPRISPTVRSWLPALGIILATQCFAGPVWIPSGSMEPTMSPGDIIMVNKLAYSFHLPLASTAEVVRFSTPKRGDIIVFNAPPAASPSEALYIKRVAAIEGDTVEVRNHHLTLNGLSLPYAELDATHAQETLGGTLHQIHALPSELANFGPYTVPAGHIFVMGDNRDNSADSRAWGPLALERVRGKALFRLAGLNPSSPKAPGSL